MKFRKVLSVESESSYPYWIDYSTVVCGEVVKEDPSTTISEFEYNDDYHLDDHCEAICSSGVWYVIRTIRNHNEVLYRIED